MTHCFIIIDYTDFKKRAKCEREELEQQIEFERKQKKIKRPTQTSQCSGVGKLTLHEHSHL